MGNFITYGVTEMLDNDQKFIIDSDRTGPGSITAKDAASSLLSKWAGFETFDEAVQNTIEHNQEFIDRDTAIREETAELKKKIVTTFPAKDASGAIATFESEFEDAPLKSCIVQIEPVQDLHGYDSPWPAGGGKNLFDKNTQTKPAYIDASGNVVSTSATGWGASDYIPVTPGDYIASKYADTGSGVYMGIYDESKNFVRAILMRTGNTATTSVTILDGESFVRLSVRNTSGEEDTAQFEKGAIATSYAPYSNECPITGWTGANINNFGKNCISNGAERQSITTSMYAKYTPVVSLEDATSVTFSVSADVPSGQTLKLYCWTGKNNTIVGTLELMPDGRYALTNADTIKLAKEFRVYSQPYTGGSSVVTTVWDCTCVINETRTDYVPYVGQTYPITFPSEAGIVYGAHVDVVNGELVATHAEVDMGTLTWTYYASGNYFYATIPDRINYIEALPKVVSMCDKYTYFGLGTSTELQNNMPNAAYGFTTTSAKRYIYLKDNRYTNVNDLVASLSGTQLVYALTKDSITTYPITPIENIKTLLGTNNIWADTGDTAVEYLMSDVGWYVEKKLRAFQSILAGVEDSEVASKNYSTDSYLIFNNDIYRVTKTITAGETIEDGVNVTKTTVAEQLLALAQA